jgi:hypothetical protein
MRLYIFSILALAACSPGKGGDYAAPGDGDSASEDADTDTGRDDSGDYDPVVPDGWVLRADLPIAGGVPAVDGAVVEIDAVDSVEGQIACTVALDTTGLAAGTSPDAEVVWAWWTIPVVPVDEPCISLPETLGIGVGELVGDVRAGLGADGYDEVAASLYGAFYAGDDGTLYVFGYAGTDADLAGDDDAANPPADGLYHLAPLYVLGLSE